MKRAFPACVAIVLTGTAAMATAQTWPVKPVRIVVAYPPGGPIDMTTRPLAQKLTEALGITVVVDNRGGANGMIGTDNVAKSPPDGYSLIVASGGSFAIGPHVNAGQPYDVFRDFVPVALFVTLPELLAVHPALPVKGVKELVALARSRPGQLNFGSSGNGSTPHLAVELLKRAAGVDMTHVPYKGMGPATMDLIGGQVQLVFADQPVLLQQVNGGKLRALAVGTQKRSANLPSVPTMAESGYPQVEAYNWYALFAPARTPAAIVGRINAEVGKVMTQPDVRAATQAQGSDATVATPEQLGALLKREYDKWGAVVKAVGVKPE